LPSRLQRLVASSSAILSQLQPIALPLAYAETLRETVAPLALAGQTTRAITQALNDRGLKPPRGGDWRATQIMRLLARLGLR
jgi:hypothetical protein